MPFTGFNFRKDASGGTGFVDNGDTFVGAISAGYSDAQRYGYVGNAPIAANLNTPKDARLGGYHFLNSTTYLFKIKLDNGTYKFRLAMGSNGATANNGLRISYGAGASDFLDVNAASVLAGSEGDALGNVVDDTTWLQAPAEGTITVTQGFITLTRSAAGTAYLKHFAYQVVPGALQPVRLDTDDTGILISAQATTTDGSASVSVAATPGIVPGMTVTGAAVPAGTTVASNGKTLSQGDFLPGSLNAVTAVTLSGGAGVVASTSPLRFAWAPYLGEKNPPGKLIAPITVVQGSPSLAVTLPDGTPHPNLIIRQVNGSPWLAYGLVPFPGTATSHTFRIVQTDTSGSFTGSPYSTSVTLSVSLAPDKPTDGVSLLSKISTGAFLQRKRVLAAMAANKWPGYQGQAIPAGNEVVATSLTDLITKMSAFSTAAASAKGSWYRIRLAAAGDWSTTPSTGPAFNFYPELGGGCIVVPDTVSPLITGACSTHDQRGVQWGPNLVFPSATKNTASLKIDHSTGQALTVVKITRNKFGYLQDPSQQVSDYKLDLTKFQDGINVTGADQATIVGNDFYGSAVAITAVAVRNLESAWNTNRVCSNDFHALAPVDTTKFTDTFSGAAPGDTDVYQHIHHNAAYGLADITVQYGFQAAGPLDGSHADFIQTRPVTAGAAGIQWRVKEGNVLHSAPTAYATNPNAPAGYTTTKRWFVGFQFGIEALEQIVHAVDINNISATSQSRGLDLTNGESWAELNTYSTPAKLPPSGAATDPADSQVTVQPANFLRKNTNLGRRRMRKCIFETGPVLSATGCAPANGHSSEDNALVAFSGLVAGASPNTVLTGPFTTDTNVETGLPDNTGRVLPTTIADSPAMSGNDVRRAVWSAMKPLADVGAQTMVNRLLPGESESITAAQAATLEVVTDGQPSGPLAGNISLRWNSLSGNAGSQAGADLTFTVL